MKHKYEKKITTTVKGLLTTDDEGRKIVIIKEKDNERAISWDELIDSVMDTEISFSNEEEA